MFTPTPNGRTASGQFAVGNAGGPGNPHARRVGELRRALLDSITVEDIQAVGVALIARAKAGEVAAIRELLDRILGKAQPPGESQPERWEITPEIAARAREIIERRCVCKSCHEGKA